MSETESKKRKLSEKLESLNKRQKQDDSSDLSQCFFKVSTSLYISLSPIFLDDPVSGIKSQHLDPLLMTFFPDAGGVVLSHFNLQLCGEDKNPVSNKSLPTPTDNDSDEEERPAPKAVAKIMYDSPISFMWIKVDLLIWKPSKGDLIEGTINMQSPSHIGLLIHDTFNASIKRDAIPKDWKFIPNQEDETVDAIEDEVEEVEATRKPSIHQPHSLGHWIDSNGLRIDGKLLFTVKYFNVSGRTVSVQGSLLEPGAVKEDLTQPFTKAEEEEEIPLSTAKPKHVTFVESVEESEESSDSSESEEESD